MVKKLENKLFMHKNACLLQCKNIYYHVEGYLLFIFSLSIQTPMHSFVFIMYLYILTILCIFPVQCIHIIVLDNS